MISFDRLFTSSSPINNRRVFFEIFFPKWSGFYVGSFDQDIKPVEALQNLACLVENTSNVWTSTYKVPHRNVVDSSKLNLREVGATIMFTEPTGNGSNFVKNSYHALFTFKRFVGFSPNIVNLVINRPFKRHSQRTIYKQWPSLICLSVQI